MVIIGMSSNILTMRLFVSLSLAILFVSSAFSNARTQDALGAEGQVGTERKGQQLWKLETGG